MRCFNVLFLGTCIASLSGCSAVKTPVAHDYQLSAYSTKQYVAKVRPVTLLVSAPEAVSGYQTEQMLYVNKPFELEAFAKNAWSSPPADMIFPLLVQSLQRTGYFYAVTSSSYSAPSDYRLDTQLLDLKQNFLRKPSVLEFSAKIVLTHVDRNKIIASRLIHLNIPCTADTPYGGVIAANKATQQFTAQAADFVIRHM